MQNSKKIRLAKDGLEMLYQIQGPAVTRLFIENGCKSIAFYGEDEFWLTLEKDGRAFLIRSGECDTAFVKRISSGSFLIRFEHELFTSDVVYKIKDGVFYKTVSVTAKTAFLLRQAATETFETPSELSRGGEGQPVFAGGEMFVGSEFPSACNGTSGNRLDIVQNPYIQLTAGGVFRSFDTVFGFRRGESLERSFEAHIKAHALKKEKPLKIYSDWGLHDELSDNICLDDKMVKDMIGLIKDLKQKYRVHFDYYLMDAFWWENGSRYLEFKKSSWPDGISDVTEKLAEAGLRFGLWFDVNMSSADLPKDAVSLRGDGRLCFADKKTADLLKTALLHHIKTTGIKMIKFDFAFFDCDNPDHKFHACGGSESKEPAIRNFTEMINELRAVQPELKILCYNVFTTDLSWIGSVVKDRPGYAVSPWWAYYVDYVYCGDPRASEIPSDQFQKSIIYYTDAMIHQMRAALLPFDFIDDDGTMCANTGTIYYLGKAPLRDSWIMNLSRGGRKLHFYGDLGLLDSNDRAFLQEAEKTFDKISRPGFHTESILGDPADGEPYGYSTSDGSEGLITVVNPSTSARTVNICLGEWSDGKDVKITPWYADNEITAKPDYKRIIKVFQTRLKPQSAASYKWTFDGITDRSRSLRLGLGSNECISLTVSEKARAVSVSFQDSDGAPIRTAAGIPDGIELEYDTDRLKPASVVRPWSGVSWTVLDRTGVPGSAVCRIENKSGKKVVILWREERCL